MAFVTDNSFRSYQGHAVPFGFARRSLSHRLPLATLALGAIAALAIGFGAFDTMMGHSTSGTLTDIEFLVGEFDTAQ